MKELLQKYEQLKASLSALGSAAVAFSSGVDSAFLLYAAREALRDQVLAITASAASFPARETGEAQAFCERLGVRQILLPFDPFAVDGFAANPPDRCYICKKALFTQMREAASAEGMAALLEGSNLDDEGDYRPGMRAIRELGILSPLRENKFTKAEIRELSRHFHLPTWDKPSYACLASRVPYGDEITAAKLRTIEEAEQHLLSLGFRQMRVRMHGQLARIEVLPEDLPRMTEPALRDTVVSRLRELGFAYVTLDLAGFRSGSMNVF